ncbi:hypothetical protein OUZ56_020172 [Daphnia magna]|uniref:Cuticle protein n=1 Tax=Daphnia magna TaxID=35525 RepID=A0ABQ9ZDS0_9CRUS|nr:hypothetical protein OUZ56_020172 [Daphnia magna]
MHQLITILVLVFSGTIAQLNLPKTPGYSTPPPKPYPPPGYSTPPPKPYPTPGYEPMMPYSFSYAVVDGPSYNNFGHQETADTKAVTGSYRVALPDGRTQIVTYKADENGYVADVRYEGKATYPENKPSYPPNYKPAYKPAYQPAPPKNYKP